MKYRTIVADPPWDYGADHKRWATSPSTVTIKHTEIPYSAMSLGDICALHVARDLADDDCRLFLWTTNRYIREAFAVLTAWGFDYKQTLVWHKTGNPSPFGGSVAPVHAEFLLVGTRGHPPISERLPSSVLSVPAVTVGHSRKPDAFLDAVERCSPGPYLEMFARRDRMGWNTWGNESLETAEAVA